MKTCTELAPGKLNLTLDVVGTRADGYHEVCMLMQTVSLYDRVTVTVGGGSWHCRCDVGGVPEDLDNLALKAAMHFCRAAAIDCGGVSVEIAKRIPIQGGMAGGSADAAAVLRAMNRLCGAPFSVSELCRLGEAVGSDVPYCVLGGTALAQGRGERLTVLPSMPKASVVLVRPDFSVSTPTLFAAVDRETDLRRPDTDAALRALRQGDLTALGRQTVNVFQPIIERSHPEVAEICAALRSFGAVGAAMTGTGSVVFGIFSDPGAAARAEASLRASYLTFSAEPV